MDNVSFNGGFLIHKPSPAMWEKVYNEIVPKRRIIANDIFEKNNILFVSKSIYDRDVLTYLLSKRNLKFSFYPNINLKTRLDSYFPKEIEKVLSSEHCTDSRKEIRAFIKQTTKPLNAILKYKWKSGDHIPQTFKALNMNSENYNIVTKNFISSVYDKNGKLIAKISPNNQQGINYAILYPRYKEELLTMYAINYQGEILSKSNDINSLNEFKKNFLHAVKIDAGRLRPTK